MNSKLLHKTQKNDVFKLIESAGLSPADFDWDTISVYGSPMGLGDANISTLIHRPTKYFCNFDMRGEFRIKYSPANEAPYEYFAGYCWEGCLGGVNNWLKYLRREIEAPDLWSIFSTKVSWETEFSETDQDEVFSNEERKVLINGIRKIVERLNELQVQGSLTAENVTKARENLTRLEIQLETSSRWAWFHTAVGVLFTIIVGQEPQFARKFFMEAGNLLFTGYHTIRGLIS